MAHGDGSLVAYQMVDDELRISLREASAMGPFTIDQQHAASKAADMEAAQERLRGRPKARVEIVRELK